MRVSVVARRRSIRYFTMMTAMAMSCDIDRAPTIPIRLTYGIVLDKAGIVTDNRDRKRYERKAESKFWQLRHCGPCCFRLLAEVKGTLNYAFRSNKRQRELEGAEQHPSIEARLSALFK